MLPVIAFKFNSLYYYTALYNTKYSLLMMSGNIRAILNDPVQIAENEINEIRFKEVPEVAVTTAII